MADAYGRTDLARAPGPLGPLTMPDAALRETFRRMFHAVIDVLNRSGLKYYLLGGVAANALARPRTTEDIDVAAFADDSEVRALLQAIRATGFVYDDEEVRTQLEMRGFFRAYYSGAHGARLWTDVVVAATPFEQRVWERRWVGHAAGQEVSVVSPEDFLLLKLLARRPKDLEDIRNLMARRGASLDRNYLRTAGADLAALAHRADLPDHLEMVLRGQLPPPAID